jgi:hypothetical protein
MTCGTAVSAVGFTGETPVPHEPPKKTHDGAAARSVPAQFPL